MSTLTSRERAQVDQVDRAAEIFSQVEDEIRDFVRRDVAGPWHRSEDRSDLSPGNIGSQLQRVSGNALQEIDDAIAALMALRHRLQNETTRVQREIVQYATITEAAQASMRTISESVAFWKKR